MRDLLSVVIADGKLMKKFDATVIVVERVVDGEQNPIDAHMRALISRVGGEFWGRGVIEPKTRSLTTMAVLCTRNLQDELALHVRLGIERYGASREEICEVIAHCAL